MFATCEPGFRQALASHLQLGVYTAGDVVFRAGDMGTDMFIVRKGSVVLLNARSEVLCVLGPGQAFGELGLLAAGHRYGSSLCKGQHREP